MYNQNKLKINNKTSRLIGAHNGLTAILAEKHGFDGIWASGLEISASLGYPDASIISMNEYLNKAIEMRNVTSLPIIADCDSGFGSLGSLKRTVIEFEKSGISGICIEDKKYPKDNSFINSKNKLYSKQEFIFMLEKVLQWRKSKDFLIIARMESLILKESIDEAIHRAILYLDTGIDLLLIHSKKHNEQEVLEFIDLLNTKLDYEPKIAIIPTTYPNIKFDDMIHRNIKMVIYANQGLRGIISKLEKIYRDINRSRSTVNIENEISSVEDIFEITGYHSLKELENEMDTLSEERSYK